MDIFSALTLMTSFGMLVAFIVSDKNHKKIISHALKGSERLFSSLPAPFVGIQSIATVSC